jgi:glycosyltransferase involved in cell wall biosynthesis
MRFQFVSTMNDSPWGGSEELWSQAAVRLHGEGHEVRASVAHWPKLSEKIIALTKRGICIDHHPSMRDPLSRRLRNKLVLDRPRAQARLKRYRPDLVVISQGHNSGGFEWARLCRRAGLPFVVIVNCNCELWWFGDQLDAAVMTYKVARRVFCVSHRNLDLLRLQTGDPLLHGEIVRNPCNVQSGHGFTWPDENNGWKLACVARIDAAAKGQDLLLQALAQPEWRDRPIEVNFYGMGPDLVALRRMAEILHLENVNFHGHVSNVDAIWEQNHLLALPSRYEGLPLALVEAMRCGRPAVVTDVGGNVELCVDGETGFVAPAATVGSISNALQRAWEQRTGWRQIGLAARERVDEVIPEDPVCSFCQKLKALAAADSKNPALPTMLLRARPPKKLRPSAQPRVSMAAIKEDHSL